MDQAAMTGQTISHYRIPEKLGANARQLTNGAREGSPSCSADGKSVYFPAANGAIEKVPADGGPSSPVLKGGQSSAISPDGKWVTYHERKESLSSLWNQPVDGGPPRQLTRPTQERLSQLDWSPDGKRLLVTRSSNIFDVVMISNFE